MVEYHWWSSNGTNRGGVKVVRDGVVSVQAFSGQKLCVAICDSFLRQSQPLLQRPQQCALCWALSRCRCRTVLFIVLKAELQI